MNALEIQAVYKSSDLPEQAQFQAWIDRALQGYGKDAEIVVRIVDEAESADLNRQYRQKNGPTNILSFPAELPEELGLNLLGDLVICAPVVEREALEQSKDLSHHWAHIVIHGLLHLLGYDHIDDEEAELMEAKEIEILGHFNIKNPYLETN